MAKMASTIPIKVKHNGKLHDIALDTAQPATAFKQAVYEKTGVPADRMKVMVKGGMLKDDHDLTKIGARPGQTFMVIGTAGELPKAPTGPITFIEDMTESELALATQSRVGLTNLGNTCYLNSTLQVLRAIPELQTALGKFDGGLGGADGERNLTAALRDLYKNLSQTTEPFPPFAFLTILRQVAPQFAEMARDGHSFAQQDAEEVWVRIIQALQNSLHGLSAPSSSSEGAAAAAGAEAAASTTTDAAAVDPSRRFVEQYMTGHMVIKRSSAEAPDEPASTSKDPFSMLQCNISSTTNEMTSGILDSLNQQIEKTSATLGRQAVYDETSRIDRLPAYLATHFVRFYWRRDINKKTKIMRKVKFPFVLDATPFLTDELKDKTKETNLAIKKIEKDRDERAKIRKRAKARKAAEEKAAREAKASGDVAMADATSSTSSTATAAGTSGEVGGEDKEKETVQTLGQALTVEEELAEREKERASIRATVHPDLAADVGCNASALYELVGIVTHKGAAADAGHYISWVRKDLDESSASNPADQLEHTDADQQWYKFDDDKVSTVARDKIAQLDGGGEDSVAYILLYRSKQI